jgi:hypothetical protein
MDYSRLAWEDQFVDMSILIIGWTALTTIKIIVTVVAVPRIPIVIVITIFILRTN